MPSAAVLRTQIEDSLARKVPSALTPAARTIRPVDPTGIQPLDHMLHGGIPQGAITELIGPECSGRTATALTYLAHLTQNGSLCAWIDASDALDPLSASAAGLCLDRLLWIRCGALIPRPPGPARTPRRGAVAPQYFAPPPIKKGLHGGGFGPHPRTEANGLSDAVSSLFPQPSSHSAPMPAPQPPKPLGYGQPSAHDDPIPPEPPARPRIAKPWSRIEQALRSTDLLLQAGGFRAIVLDMASLAPEFVSRIPLATWYRYRAAADRTQAAIVLLTQYGCAKSSAELTLEFQPAAPLCIERTVFTGIQPQVHRVRQRFAPTGSNVLPLRKPPQSIQAASWQSRTPWAGPR